MQVSLLKFEDNGPYPGKGLRKLIDSSAIIHEKSTHTSKGLLAGPVVFASYILLL